MSDLDRLIGAINRLMFFRGSRRWPIRMTQRNHTRPHKMHMKLNPTWFITILFALSQPSLCLGGLLTGPKGCFETMSGVAHGNDVRAVESDCSASGQNQVVMVSGARHLEDQDALKRLHDEGLFGPRPCSPRPASSLQHSGSFRKPRRLPPCACA